LDFILDWYSKACYNTLCQKGGKERKQLSLLTFFGSTRSHSEHGS